MSDMQILHYGIKYQDANIVVIKFSKNELIDFLKNSLVWMEMGENPNYFWECFEEALMEISGVEYAIVDGWEITAIKDPCFPNWGRIVEDVIWCSIFFLNPNGGAIQVSKDGKEIGKLVAPRFDAVEPEYPRKKQ